jgi:hypothetical protein
MESLPPSLPPFTFSLNNINCIVPKVFLISISISLLTRKQSLDDRDDDDNFSNGHPYNETERSYGYKSCTKREKSVSYSDSRFTQRSQRKNLHDYYTDHDNSDDDRLEKSSHSSIAVRDRRSYHHLERSSSEVEDMPSCPKLHRKKRHKYHHRSSKKHCERIDKCGSDSSRSHHQTHKEKEVERKRNRPDDKRHNYKCHSHTESGVDQSLSIDQKRQQKESSHTSRHSKHNPKSGTDNLSHDRWQMVSGSDKDSGEQYHSCKRKRVH